MSRSFNREVEKIAVSDIRQFDSDVSGIPGIIKLTLGEPDFNTPEHVKKLQLRQLKITNLTILLMLVLWN